MKHCTVYSSVQWRKNKFVLKMEEMRILILWYWLFSCTAAVQMLNKCTTEYWIMYLFGLILCNLLFRFFTDKCTFLGFLLISFVKLRKHLKSVCWKLHQLFFLILITILRQYDRLLLTSVLRYGTAQEIIIMGWLYFQLLRKISTSFLFDFVRVYHTNQRKCINFSFEHITNRVDFIYTPFHISPSRIKSVYPK